MLDTIQIVRAKKHQKQNANVGQERCCAQRNRDSKKSNHEGGRMTLNPTLEIIRLLDLFLREKRKCSIDGDEAPVAIGDALQLEDLIHAIVKVKWEADPHGDRPIVVRVEDSSRYQRAYFLPLPLINKESPFDLASECVTLASSNVKTAVDRLNDAIAIRDEIKRKLAL
jgi:hypothetical protein